jgi:hypothetical protein
MKIAVIGSRSFTNGYFMENALINLFDAEDVLISGGAVGTDQLAEKFADKNLIAKEIFLPNYALERAATHIRNDEMLKVADFFIVFYDGASKGTASMIRKIKSKKKKMIIFAV